MSKWRNTSVKIFLSIFFICILLFAFSFVNSTKYTGQSITDAYDLPIGQSMFEGDSILGQRDPIILPLLGNLNFLSHEFRALDIKDIFMTLETGVVQFDFTTVSSEGIDAYGNVVNVDGPGYLTLEGDKLAVKEPETYVWGYSAPYKYLTKTSAGVDVVENGTVVDSIPEDKIKDYEFGNDYFNTSNVRYWYNHEAVEGSNYTLEKGIVEFSDGRSDISSGNVSYIFGEDVADYVAAYPEGTPIVLYMGNTTKSDGEMYYTYLGSYPQYGDSVREYNARQFVKAWNGTIIPPNSTSNGRDYIDFGSAKDSTAPGGSAAHGVCPPARALRGVVLAEGFSLPTGMSTDENAVLFGFNPARDIKVTNNHDFPVQIEMWTDGSGSGMAIYAKIMRYLPNE